MTGNARHTVVVERPFDVRILSQRAAEQRRRIMTRLAMTREFNSLLSLQILDVFLIEGFTKSVPVRRLPPLSVSVCVTGAAALGRHKHLSRNERTGRSSRVAGREWIGTELKIVCLGYFNGIGILVVVIVGICRNSRAFGEGQHGQGKQDQA